MTPQELQAILKDHAAWRADPTKGKRADLTGATLGVGLRWARIGPQGSRGDEIVYLYGPNRDEAHTGCFTGTLDELTAKVMKQHHGTQHEQDYNRAIAYLRSLKEAQK